MIDTSSLTLELQEELQEIITVYGSKRLQSAVKSAKPIENETYKLFLEWWDSYPSNNGHGAFLATRSLKIAQEECYILWKEAVKKYSPEDLILAIQKEVNNRRYSSLTNNEMSYMKNSKNYLLNKDYEGFITGEVSEQLKTALK